MLTIHCGRESDLDEVAATFDRMAMAVKIAGVRALVEVRVAELDESGDEALVWTDGDSDEELLVIAALDALAVAELEAMATFDNDDPADW